MFKNYFKTAWRNLRYNKKYSVVNIAALAVSIAACILIGLFVQNELSFDSNIPNKKNIYRLNELMHYDGTVPQLSAAIGPPIAPLLKNTYQQIENYTRVLPATPDIYPSVTLAYNGKKIKTDKMICTDTSFVDMFGALLIEGNKNNFISTQNSIALTQSFAKRLFGNTSALNKMITLSVNDSTIYHFNVTAVIKDFPANSHLQFEGLLPIPKEFEEGFLGTNYGVILGPTYLRLSPSANIKALDEAFTKTVQEKNKFIDMKLQPVQQIHSASADIGYDYFNNKKSDGKYVKIFIVIALAIFVIACFNFINLSIAIAAYRGKEISVKKILGAERIQIALQILAEAFLSVLIAISFSILIALFFLPYLNHIIDRDLQLSNLYQPAFIIFYAAIIVVTTLLTGLYPALMVSSFKISSALKNKVLFGGTRRSFRNILVTGQFVIAIVFIISLIVFMRQLQFLKNKDLGYSYSQVIKMPLDVQDASRLPVLKSELLKIKGVTDVTNGYIEMGGRGSLFGIDYTAPDGEHKHISVNFENAGSNYIQFFGMRMAAGSSFTKDNNGNEYLINETLAKQIGYKNPLGKQINLTSFPAGIITGVVKDFNYQSLHTKIEPLIIGNFNGIPAWQNQLYIKIASADIFNSFGEINKTIKNITGDSNPNLQFLDDHFKEVYSFEKQAETMIAIIGGLAIAIACIGLFSLTAFVIAKRTKEISIRKVLGASAISITEMLSKGFITIIIIAFFIAAPIAYWLMNQWLQGFAYRINIAWWIFAIAGLSVLLIALITLSFQSIKAAIANPVKSLRTE